MSMPEILTATKADNSKVIDTLIMGFAADPLVRWFFPTAELYLKASGALFNAYGGIEIDTTLALASENFEGVAVWQPPGTHVDEDAVGDEITKYISEDIIDEVVAVFEKVETYHPEGDIWYLPLIAVDPAHQGKGLGAALMKAALQQCDDAGLPAYLESSNQRNITLYQRHGFEIMGEIQLGSSPIVTPMLRPAVR